MTRGWRRFAWPIAIAVAAVVVALVFHRRLIAWFTGDDAGGGRSAGVHVKAGTLDVAASNQPDPPRQEGNRLRLDVTDATGAPVDGADVALTYDMPAMGAMAEMKGTLPASSLGQGHYEVAMDLPMGGSWTLIAEIKTATEHAIARYTLTVGTPGLTALGGSATAAGAGPGGDQPGMIRIDEARRKTLGIRIGKAARAPMTLDLRAIGRLTYDETRLTDVTLKLSGFITELRVATTGQAVHKGESLFTLYSPELYAAQQDYLLARRGQEVATMAGGGPRSDALLRAAEKKLELWGLSAKQIASLAERGEPIESVSFPSPASGYVIEKNVVEGASVEAGQRLFRIAALDEIWVEADVYEADLPYVHKGQAAAITLDHLPGRSFDGKVAFIYPYLDPQSRSGRVRITLANKALELKPDMFATVTFHVELGDRLQVPISAVVYTGPRRLVFVDLGDGQLVPREVELGAQTADQVEVVSGLQDGDAVVTSGNFLVAAESRIRSSGTYWQDTP